tara:strand:+ start:1688 stop:2701 length:1014 start_codon:yes stop_codon:yes gene_type:complete
MIYKIFSLFNMDDYNLSVLIESKNEWCARLVNLLTPCIFDGLKSIYDESIKICNNEEQLEKYLMTFQNLLTAIPNWSPEIINKEVQNIIEKTKCGYIEDLISCVHIAHLKSLTSSRVGTQQKKIDIDIPNLQNFVHKVYINTARKIYSNIFLYELNQVPLQKQKNNREIEYIIKECILNTIRENIPVEQILRAYIDETEETDIIVEEKKEIIPLENKKVKSIESIVLEDKENNIKSVNDSLTKEVKIENDTPTMENITNEIKEIDQLLNNTNSSEELVEDANEINIDTEIGNLQSNEKTDDTGDKVKITDEINDLPIDLDTLNSDIEDLELEIDELP